jgi:2-polyprenyl-6-methoxyphenol hydroxylase-like FAD-dependent oxidoreductase
MRIAIVGGGAAGLLAALLLARTGHEATLLEQDRLVPAPDIESAAASAFRPAAPHIVQPHIVMSRCRELLRQRLPDVYDALIAAGVVEVPISAQMPPSLADTTAQPGDERLMVLMSRRSTIDWVLQRAVLAEPGVEPRGGVRVTGLLAAPGEPPHVTGVRTGQGDVEADLVVDATGRRSPIDRWLEQIGAQPTATWRAECGLAYFSRHYRLRPGAELPGLPSTRILAGFDEFTAGIWGADNQAMQMAVAPLAADRRFRTLRDPDAFTSVLRTVPVYAAWLDTMDPISPVFPMAGLHNTLRRLVTGGAPVVTGLHAIGDSICTTNPTLGRGLTLALSGIADLADTLSKHDGDWMAQALALDRLAADHVAPFYGDQAASDASRLAMLRHAIFGAPAPDPPPVLPDRVSYAQIRAAALLNPTAFRALWTINGMLRQPAEVYTDPQVVACTQQVLKQLSGAQPVTGPTRQQLLTALAG